MPDIFSSDFQENKQYIDETLNVKENFDVVFRAIHFGGRRACFYFIDGFCKDEILERMLEFLFSIPENEMPENAQEFSKKKIPYGEIDLIQDKEKFLQMVLSGMPCLLVEGYSEVLGIDFRTYPARGVDEPSKDKVMRGSKDGFVETIVFNTALIRRRIRNQNLTMEMHTVGKSSKTDVVIAYMKGRVEDEMLEEIRKRIDNIDIDALTMNGESLAESIYQHKWYNPFPKFRFTERPDTTSASILEGSICILVDNSPSAMIIPTTIFDIVEDADDYYFPPITGTYLRLSRFVINFIAVFLTPIFLLLMKNQEWIPQAFSFIIIKDAIHIPILFQLLMLEFAIDGLKMASLSTPNSLSTPLSVVAGIVLGDYTVSSGWFNSEIMLYMAFVIVANNSQPSLELGYALKFMRIILLFATAFFNVYGFIAGILIVLAFIVTNKTISGKSYIYPLIPFNGKQFLRRFFRVSLPKARDR